MDVLKTNIKSHLGNLQASYLIKQRTAGEALQEKTFSIVFCLYFVLFLFFFYIKICLFFLDDKR